MQIQISKLDDHTLQIQEPFACGSTSLIVTRAATEISIHVMREAGSFLLY